MSRILVVDDDVLVASAIQFWLAGQGDGVVTAHGGTDGLAALTREHFDLMIVDIFAPHMDGFESVQRFHAAAPDTPLIVISGHTFAESHSPAPDFLRMTLALGAAGCISKPFKPRDLLAMIRDCLAEAPTLPIALDVVRLPGIGPIIEISPVLSSETPRGAEN